jgi:N-acetylmuramoyl-L-alanine amidase
MSKLRLSETKRAARIAGLAPLPILRPVLGLLLGLALGFPAVFVSGARADSKTDSQKQFERAVKMRTMLEGYLEKDRSESDYKQTAQAYRKVYLITPEAPDATPALVAEAELFRDMGRLYDAKYFQQAIDRYNFLLKQYPGTRFRADVLFDIGKIQKDDLKKPDDAQETFRQFLKRYPRSDKAADAQQALKEIADARQTSTRQNASAAPGRTDQAATQQPKGSAKPASQRPPDSHDAAATAALTTTTVAKGSADPRPATDTTSTATSNTGTDAAKKTRRQDQEQAANRTVSDSQPELKGQAVEPRVGNRISNVMRVQTWNSPDSTRVIVTLNDTIKYESARIASPDRIYFNIYKAHVGAKISRAAIDVNDGLLESVRVAQNKPDVVRLVLNVDGDRDYSAFLLANPYRLVIDIHSRAVNTAKSSRGVASAPAALAAEAVPNPVPPAVAPSPAPAPAVISDITVSKTAKAAQPPVRPTPPSGDASAAVNSSVALAGKPAEKALAKGVAEKSANASADASAPTASTDENQTPGKVAEKTVLPLPKKAGKTSALLEPPTEAKPTRDGQRSLARALGLKINRIVIDAGHGGHDTGTIGPHGLMEKDLCLDVALRLGSLIEQKLPGADVIYTRNDDTFVPLEERTAIANRAQADLFISIHANSSRDGSARGVETYYLNFATTQESMEVASRENAASQESLHDLQDLIKKIARNDKIEESKELASDVQDSLTQRLQLVSHGERNRGVKKAPFVVLIGADMPSILSEISFVSNPNDEKLLRKSDQRERIADGLFRGINSYLASLNSLSNNKQKLVSDNPADPGTVASNGNPK